MQRDSERDRAAVAAAARQNQPGSRPQEFYWLDILVLNQHNVRASVIPSDYWTSTFRDLVRKVGSTVLVLSPWQSPEPMRRSWILWELYCTYYAEAAATAAELRKNESRRVLERERDASARGSWTPSSARQRRERDEACSFTVALPPRETESFQQALADPQKSTRGVLHRVFAAVDARKATATNERDRAHINAAIAASEGGFSTLNSQVMRRMRTWAIMAGEGYIDQLCAEAGYANSAGAGASCGGGLAAKLREGGERQAAALRLAAAAQNFAVLLKDLEHLAAALRFYRLALDVHRGLDAVDPGGGGDGASEGALASMHSIATLLRKQGGAANLEEAERLSRTVLAAKEAAHGPAHKDALRTRHALATILRERVALRRHSARQRGAAAAAAANTGAEAGADAGAGADADTDAWAREAEELFERALEGRARVLGATHPDTLRTMVNLAQLLELKVPSRTWRRRRRASLRSVTDTAGRAEGDIEREPCGPCVARAEALYREAHAAEVQLQGQRHTKTCKTATLLASLLHSSGVALQREAYWLVQEAGGGVISETEDVAGDAKEDGWGAALAATPVAAFSSGVKKAAARRVRTQAWRKMDESLALRVGTLAALSEQFGPTHTDVFDVMIATAHAQRERGDWLSVWQGGAHEINAQRAYALGIDRPPRGSGGERGRDDGEARPGPLWIGGSAWASLGGVGGEASEVWRDAAVAYRAAVTTWINGTHFLAKLPFAKRADGAQAIAAVDSSVDIPADAKYLLYDVGFGERFNFRKSVFRRVMGTLRVLEKHAADLGPWVLVLPPFRDVAHGMESFAPFSTFMQIAKMREGLHPLIIDFHDYVERVGARVDHIIMPTSDHKFDNAVGNACTVAVKKAARQINFANREIRHFHRRLTFKSLQCMWSPGARSPELKDAIRAAVEGGAQSLIIEAVEQVRPADSHKHPYWAVRQHMHFADALHRAAEEWRTKAFAEPDAPYIAMHMRRGDFTHAHAKKQSTMDEIVERFAALSKEHSIRQFFVATDAARGEVSKMKQKLLEQHGIHMYKMYISDTNLASDT
eukprot:g6048.t1